MPGQEKDNDAFYFGSDVMMQLYAPLPGDEVPMIKLPDYSN